ncbi:acetate kinase [Humibacillus sp. DSM 29435]|uniref:acetate kinase n=1 Tax=Humibacillus sp. DSM 29435 TaxID=1869167 RepID=UPI000A5A545F|nr:acetate kinase [Humibacillus sp. DSM 29435]
MSSATRQDASPVLVLNAGSSSLKFQLLVPETAQVLATGLVENIGEQGSSVADHGAALAVMTSELTSAGVDLDRDPLRAVGHRVVHGGSYFSDPVLIDDAVLGHVRDLIPLAPLHNPGAVTGIVAARARFAVPQVAVFDTAFFADLPLPAATYAVPRELAAKHRIRRYGFHGTSHQFVSAAAAELVGRPLADLDQIVLHLGNGCSASAVRGGRAIDTSMGLTPLEGLVMGTRSGDVDPGLHAFLHREEGLTSEQVDALLNQRSGLLGLAGANDFRTLERLMGEGDEHATLAFEVVVHRIKHYVGAYLAQLGHLDVLSFTAGVGQHSATLRAAVVAGLGGLGLRLDAERNGAPSSAARIISTDDSPVTIAVVPTNEELAIARQTAALVR